MAIGAFGQPCVERHSAFIYDRGGMDRLQSLVDLSKVEWNRAMDSTASATVRISGSACTAQSQKLSEIETRRHELVIFRGTERVFEGPIVQTDSSSTFFEVTANDVTEYLNGTALSVDWPGPPIGPVLMVDRIAQIIEYELTTDYMMMTNDGPVLVKRWENVSPPANILPFLNIGAGTTETTSETEAFQMTVGTHLSNLGQSVGVSFTAVGRSIVVWDGELSKTRTITEKDINGDMMVMTDGSGFHVISHVMGQNQQQGQPVMVGHAANDLSYFGPWEAVVSVNNGTSTTPQESGESSAMIARDQQSALNSQARRDLYGQYPVPKLLQTPTGSTLTLTQDLGINDLVAGVNIPVRAQHNITPVSQEQRLQSMKVTEDPTGEQIAVTLAAAGAVIY